MATNEENTKPIEADDDVSSFTLYMEPNFHDFFTGGKRNGDDYSTR